MLKRPKNFLNSFGAFVFLLANSQKYIADCLVEYYDFSRKRMQNQSEVH